MRKRNLKYLIVKKSYNEGAVYEYEQKRKISNFIKEFFSPCFTILSAIVYFLAFLYENSYVRFINASNVNVEVNIYKFVYLICFVVCFCCSYYFIRHVQLQVYSSSNKGSSINDDKLTAFCHLCIILCFLLITFSFFYCIFINERIITIILLFLWLINFWCLQRSFKSEKLCELLIIVFFMTMILTINLVLLFLEKTSNISMCMIIGMIKENKLIIIKLFILLFVILAICNVLIILIENSINGFKSLYEEIVYIPHVKTNIKIIIFMLLISCFFLIYYCFVCPILVDIQLSLSSKNQYVVFSEKDNQIYFPTKKNNNNIYVSNKDKKYFLYYVVYENKNYLCLKPIEYKDKVKDKDIINLKDSKPDETTTYVVNKSKVGVVYTISNSDDVKKSLKNDGFTIPN